MRCCAAWVSQNGGFANLRSYTIYFLLNNEHYIVFSLLNYNDCGMLKRGGAYTSGLLHVVTAITI